jgi:hypothetical protein
VKNRIYLFVAACPSLMPLVESRQSDPCHLELEEYMKCVKEHPGGLKETDCDDKKEVFKACMKNHRSSRTHETYRQSSS